MATDSLRSGSLTDYEASLIMALLITKEYEQQQILGFINALRTRDKKGLVNNGRIAEVKYVMDGKLDKLSPGKVARYTKIQPATPYQTDEFLNECKFIGAYEDSVADPLSEIALTRIVNIRQGEGAYLNISETDRIECKKSFDAPIKTIAAFANNKGGYFFFGVLDKTWEIIGLEDRKFENFDLKILNTLIRSKLGADLQIQKKTVEFKNKKVGILYIAPAQIKPLIFINGEGDVAQGHIYYRYAGEDRLISPQDLQRLIEDRIKQLSETVLLKHLGNILKAGIDNAAVVNLESGEVSAKAGSFVIDEELLHKISFIKEGEFVEKSGMPTLKLIGDIKAAGKVIATKKEDKLKLYPLSYKELAALVCQELPSTSTNEINDCIKLHKIKENPRCSVYNFRNKKQADAYDSTKKVPRGTPSIYNQHAVDLIVEKLK